MTLTLRFGTIVAMVLTLLGSAKAAASDPAETLRALVAALEDYQANMIMDDEDRNAIIEAFDEVASDEPTAKIYKKLGAEMKKAVAAEVAARNKEIALVYKVAVRELKAGKATKQQLKDAAAEYSLTLARVKDGTRVFNAYVDRVTREYTRAL